MSINPSLKYPLVEKLDPIVESDNVLSDFEDIDYEFYDDNSYVLFNPKLNDQDLISLTTSDKEYDILSSTDFSDEKELSPSVGDNNNSTRNNNTNNINVLNKINQWYLTNIHTNYLLNDNIASWNFDDAKVNSSHYFYGDELFKYFDSHDYKKLNHITSLINSKYLNDRVNTQLNSLLNRFINPRVRPSLVSTLSTISSSTSSIIMVGGDNSWSDL